jgi:hypothetical protein
MFGFNTINQFIKGKAVGAFGQAKKILSGDKAAIARSLSYSGIGTRVGLTSAYMGAGTAASALLGSFESQQRSYYGEEKYNQYYGSGASVAKNIVFGVTAFTAGGAVFGRDPLTKLFNTTAAYGGKAIGKGLGMIDKMFFANNRTSFRVIPQSPGTLPRMPGAPRFRSALDRSKFSNTKDYNKAVSGLRKKGISLIQQLGEEGFSLLKGPNVRFGKKGALSKTSDYFNRVGEKYMDTPKFGRFTAAAVATLIGGNTFLSKTLDTAGPMGVLGAAAVVPASYLAGAIHKAKGAVPTAITLGAMAATYGSISRIKKSQVAEGTITDMSYASAPSAVSKMNFSTAGLVQALHSANRKY